MKISRKHLTLVSIILILSLFVGCGKTAKVKNDAAVTDVSAAVASVMSENALVSVDSDYIAGSMKMDVSDYDSYDVKINSKGINIDEYGIFKAKDAAQLATVTKAVNDYIQMRKDTWMVEYMPEERPKLDSSEIMILGNYVMYAILSDNDKHAAFDAFEKALTT
ncbi:MAG: hypothetical protein CVU91_07585 [Firmicutes bacterium HGW-Firmicutes-16]|nr:MAG: hypothetical protein CVU91_07585 [Firmicutes bacterium HGW-Firmicutes-16]